MDELREKIRVDIQRTAGYSEAENKKSFMVGADVAFSLASEHYSKEIKSLKELSETYKTMYESVSKDMNTLTGIIGKYIKD